MIQQASTGLTTTNRWTLQHSGGGGLIPLDFKHMTIQVSDKRVGSYRLCSFIPVSLGKVSIQSIRKTTPTIR